MCLTTEPSLFWRLVRIFSASVIVVWLLLLIWLITVALVDGRGQFQREIKTYSQQILPVAVALQDSPETLAEIFGNIERLEKTLEDDPSNELFIDLSVDGNRVYEGAVGFSSPALGDGYEDIHQEGEIWWSFTSVDETGRVKARVSIEAGVNANLDVPEQIAVFFLPLIVSLPLLLVPAWFMARIGLRPLSKTADLISERIASRSLEPLPPTGYRELSSVTFALNRLFGRLGDQLARERTLVAEVAHELKTPLAIVQTNRGILESSTDEGRRAAALKDIGAGIARCNHLVQQLLGLARLEKELGASSRQRNADLAEFVRLRLAHAETLASARSVSLDLLAPERLLVRLDLDAFAAALDNLLDNAIKYSPVGGVVRVELSLGVADGNVHLRIVDQGPGIPAELRGKAFQRFERLAANKPGTQLDSDVDGAGLGLTIVSRAASRLGGKIRLSDAVVRSVGPRGLEAYLLVPFTEAIE